MLSPCAGAMRSLAFAGMAAAATGVARGDAPRLDFLEPDSVAPNTPLVLVLAGDGFAPGARVMIETARSGRYVPHRPTSVEPQRCRVNLPLGFGPVPAERRVALENPDGGRSETLVLRIGESAAEDPPGDGGGDDSPEEDGDLDLAPQDEADEQGPVILGLYPSQVPAGRPLVLEVHGVNFTAESEVWVWANVHAGSSRLPEYELKPFPTRFVDSELLEVELDRGFYPEPGARDVVVQDASGQRSPPAVMMIRMEEER